MQQNIPRVVLAGTGSGCGKTTITCAVLQAFVNRNKNVGAFKCGPDYIDPMFHSKIIGAPSSNLDLFFFDENTARYLLAKNGAERDLNIIEGVMGFYDGLSLSSTEASTYHVSEATESPVVLVVNAKGAALSVLAMIRGFLEFYPQNRICGVILNHCTEMTYRSLADVILERFEHRVRPLGFMPKMPNCSLESRHLGLVTAAEVEDLKEKMQLLAAQAEKTVDLDGLMEMAAKAVSVDYEPITFPVYDDPVRIAVAKDRAFCFYYEDSLVVLEEMGAELVPFSPLNDKELPKPIHGLYLGGGYPELYAGKLSRNKTMRHSIYDALTRKIPCIAECGGFMYLTEAIGEIPMVGFLNGKCRNNERLTRFGYVNLHAEKDNMLCKHGEEIRGHEFHYWDCENNGDVFTAIKPSGKSWNCVVADDRLYAGYPHFHFYSNPAFAVNFYEACRKEKHRHA